MEGQENRDSRQKTMKKAKAGMVAGGGPRPGDEPPRKQMIPNKVMFVYIIEVDES